MFKNALVSVSDKSGLIEFLSPLQKKYGTRIVSTGGTFEFLKKNGIDVVEVSSQTNFLEVMDGRVKTLHPHIHMGLLARPNNKDDEETLKSFNLEAFDLVVGNLYPFLDSLGKEMDLRDQIELIDVGGPSFLRAAAKNFQRITVVCDPEDYDKVLLMKETDLQERQELAAKVFSQLSFYDKAISSYLSGSFLECKDEITILAKKIKKLRYGENPQQEAFWYKTEFKKKGLHEADLIQGKELSYNNILDIDAAVSTLREFSKNICCVSVKHNNPCGVALGDSLEKATALSLGADPKSIFGGIVAVNQPLDKSSAQLMEKIFLECIVAPSFSKESLEILSKKKNLRLLSWHNLMNSEEDLKIRSVCGGLVIQTQDQLNLNWDEFEFIGDQPTFLQKKSLEFAWKVCAHLKSNAIVVGCENQTLGMGMGQVNRIDAVKQALGRAKEFHPKKSKDIILASDAFFPFADSLKEASCGGVRWIIQPGGSLRDDEVKSEAKTLGLNMVLTGRRHFYH